jgi:RNase adapter protein RapZ
LFLDAEDDILIRRYSQTRRPHPITEARSLRESIDIERQRLKTVRSSADMILDTTEHSVHSLKAALLERFTKDSVRPLSVQVLTFGFKYGLASECDLVFDVRFLKNPYFVNALRDFTGLDQEVFDFVVGQPEAGEFLRLFREYANFLLPLYQREGKSYLTIGVGCTGGRHRSVSIGTAITSRLRGRGWTVQISHRDVERESPQEQNPIGEP